MDTFKYHKIIAAAFAIIILSTTVGCNNREKKFTIPDKISYAYGISNIPPLHWEPSKPISIDEVRSSLQYPLVFNLTNDTIVIIKIHSAEGNTSVYCYSHEDKVYFQDGHYTPFSAYITRLINEWDISELSTVYDSARAGLLGNEWTDSSWVTVDRVLILDSIARFESIEFENIDLKRAARHVKTNS